MFICACSSPPEKAKIYLSGTIDPGDAINTSDTPIVLLIAKGDNIDMIEEKPMDYVLAMISIDLSTHAFRIDLTEKNVKAGDKVSVIAFADNDYAQGIPYPTLGDVLGIYIDEDNMASTYVLQEGENKGVHIELNRHVYEFDARVKGTVTGSDQGDLRLVAYAGELTSTDFSQLDYSVVVGYNYIEKGKNPVEFDMKIMPYGFNVPISNAYIFALLDVNKNGKADEGDKIGFYSAPDDNYPTRLTIDEGTISGLNINFAMDVIEPSGYTMSLKGELILPQAAAGISDPAYVVVAKAENPDDLFENPVSYIACFEKIPEGETVFDIDLSKTALVPGDEIMIIALWDKDHESGLPEPRENDYLGLYLNTESLAMTYVLKDGVNEGIEIDINREVFSFKAEVQGEVKGDEKGKLIIIAYAGDITSLNLDKLDYDRIVMYKEFDKGSKPLDYAIPVFPYGQNVPISDVTVFALLDKNGNGKPDSGDRIGFHTSGLDKMPESLTITEGLLQGIDIEMVMDISEPSGFDISIQGELLFSESDASPTYIIVAKSDDLSAIMDDPVSSIEFFEKVPDGASHFDIDLSSSGLKPGDDVILLALKDKDKKGAFPNPTEGDLAGVYINAEALGITYKLKEGRNQGIVIDLNREVFSFESEISGSINGSGSGDLLMIAYAGELNSLDFTQIDFNKVIGYQQFDNVVLPMNYSLSIIPYGMDVPIENVYIFAILDKNKNGLPDPGDIIGYPVDSHQMPKLITATEGKKSGVDMNMVFNVPVPSGRDMAIEGKIETPAGYTASSKKPIYIIIAEGDDPNAVFSDPANAVKAFQKLPAGETHFSIDLSGTDLVPGDEVLVLGLWDKDYTAGFPNPTEGDYAGFYLDREKLLVSVTLTDGINTINPGNGYEFRLNRIIYEHQASVSFEFEDGDLPRSMDDNGDGDKLDPGDSVIVILLQKKGLNNGVDLVNLDMAADVDYVVGMDSFTVSDENTYTIHVLPAIFEEITVESLIDNVYLLAILDANGNGSPDKGEYIGYYWYSGLDTLYLYLPTTVDLTDGENPLKRTIRFSGLRY